ncbi:MAG: hypothetical protein ACFFF4_15660 [Candidatus Thorarchaeota archaeon]
MASPPMISVVTPFHSTNHKLPQIRRALASAKVPIQFIMVLNNPKLSNRITVQNSNESIVIASRKGRGFAFLEGIANIKGNFTMLLHSDTIPPFGWDRAILTALENPQVVGGGFSMTYGRRKPYLRVGIWIMNQWFRVTGDLYGDRAMFIRSKFLKNCHSALEVPIFEDLRLAKCMHKQGKVVLLSEKVETDAKDFRVLGFRKYFGNFPLCRIWYALGVSLDQIFKFYYTVNE